MLAIDQGGDVVLLNTGFAAEQLAAAAQAYGIGLVVHDDNSAPLLAETAVAALDLAGLMALGDGRPDGGVLRPRPRVGATSSLYQWHDTHKFRGAIPEAS